MNINKRFILSFVAPFMILISAIGMSRQLDRKNILKKIKSYQKAK